MGFREYRTWVAYRNKYGPLNPVRMYDQASALVATEVNHMRGGKAKPLDFMPYAPASPEREMTDEEILNGLLIGGKIVR